MPTPYTTRPKVTQLDISNGFVTRYFVQHISTKLITEVDKKQYEAFKTNVLYERVDFPWIITGLANDTLSSNGTVIYGTKHKNTVTTTFYNKKMPGLTRLLYNPLEGFQGVRNPELVLPNPTPTYSSGTGVGRTINPTVTPTSSTTPTEIQADYWWRADSGLSTSGWTAYNGSVNFTFTNVTTADSTNGAVFNGTNGFGVTSNLASNITAKHVFLRVENFTAGTQDSILGGTQDIIHEIGFRDAGYWYVVDKTGTGTLRYGIRTTTNIAPSNLIWFDFTNASNVRVYLEDGASPTATLSTYAGTFTNNFIWQSGYGIYLARRGQVSGGNGFMRMDVKELAIFTSSLSTEQAKEFRTEMLNRYPI